MGELDERFDAIADRIEKAKSTWGGLTIRGLGWAGDSEQGFIFNPEVETAAAAGAAFRSCPNTSSMTLVLSGISFPCGCHTAAGGTSFRFDTPNINGTYIKNLEFAIPGVESAWDIPTATGTMHSHSFSDTACTANEAINTQTFLGGVFCFFPGGIPELPNGGLVVFSYIPPVIAFYGLHHGEATSPLVIPNILTTCFATVPQPSALFGPDILAVGLGGTATVTW